MPFSTRSPNETILIQNSRDASNVVQSAAAIRMPLTVTITSAGTTTRCEPRIAVKAARRRSSVRVRAGAKHDPIDRQRGAAADHQRREVQVADHQRHHLVVA